MDKLKMYCFRMDSDVVEKFEMSIHVDKVKVRWVESDNRAITLYYNFEHIDRDVLVSDGFSHATVCGRGGAILHIFREEKERDRLFAKWHGEAVNVLGVLDEDNSLPVDYALIRTATP